jgi:hypothetical protein
VRKCGVLALCIRWPICVCAQRPLVWRAAWQPARRHCSLRCDMLRFDSRRLRAPLPSLSALPSSAANEVSAAERQMMLREINGSRHTARRVAYDNATIKRVGTHRHTTRFDSKIGHTKRLVHITLHGTHGGSFDARAPARAIFAPKSKRRSHNPSTREF